MPAKLDDLKDTIELSSFHLSSIRGKVLPFNSSLNEKHDTPFPRPEHQCLSWYRFKPETAIPILVKGQVDGGLPALVTALFDLSFFRSIVAHNYSPSPSAQQPHDPASLFTLLLMATLDGVSSVHDLAEDLQQTVKGMLYRERAGISMDAIPSEATFSNFVKRVGIGPLQETMHSFVLFFRDIGLISGELLSTDGRLIETAARFRGCNYACEGCDCLRKERLEEEILAQLGQRRGKIELVCPYKEVEKKVRAATKKKGKERLPMSLLMQVSYLDDQEPSRDTRWLAEVLKTSPEELPNLRILHHRLVVQEGEELGYRCHKRPADLEAGTGYHIDPKTGKATPVFGFNEMTTTDKNLTLGLELPVMMTTMPGNGDEARALLPHREELARTLPFHVGQVHTLDSRYDSSEVYRKLHERGVTAIIDYNPRRENQSEEAQRRRGHDLNGVPFAPCGRSCSSNGYYRKGGRRMFVCRHGCRKEGIPDGSCPYYTNHLGFSKAMLLEDYPRLVGPVQRGTPRWRELYGHRTASERENSYDSRVMRQGSPLRVMGLLSVSFKGLLRTAGQLLRRGLGFVLKVTHYLGGAPVAPGR